MKLKGNSAKEKSIGRELQGIATYFNVTQWRARQTLQIRLVQNCVELQPATFQQHYTALQFRSTCEHWESTAAIKSQLRTRVWLVFNSNTLHWLCTLIDALTTLRILYRICMPKAALSHGRNKLIDANLNQEIFGQGEIELKQRSAKPKLS